MASNASANAAMASADAAASAVDHHNARPGNFFT